MVGPLFGCQTEQGLPDSINDRLAYATFALSKASASPPAKGSGSSTTAACLDWSFLRSSAVSEAKASVCDPAASMAGAGPIRRSDGNTSAWGLKRLFPHPFSHSDSLFTHGSGSALAARGLPWPRCLPEAHRVLQSISLASVGAECLVRTRRMSHPTAALYEPYSATPSGPAQSP